MDRLEQISTSAAAVIAAAGSLAELDEQRVRWLGKKGELTLSLIHISEPTRPY